MNQSRYSQAQLLDTQGLRCPEPIMMLHAMVRKASADQQILLLATDPATLRDVPKFCQFLGHRLIDQWQESQHYYYVLQVTKS